MKADYVSVFNPRYGMKNGGRKEEYIGNYKIMCRMIWG